MVDFADLIDQLKDASYNKGYARARTTFTRGGDPFHDELGATRAEARVEQALLEAIREIREETHDDTLPHIV